jgi:hypothetical protein
MTVLRSGESSFSANFTYYIMESGEICLMAMKELDVIRIHKDGSGSFEGKHAVEVWRLTLIAQGLKLELSAPPEAPPFISNLNEAKKTTGLRTNSREVQLERILLMLEQAKTQVVYLEDE